MQLMKGYRQLAMFRFLFTVLAAAPTPPAHTLPPRLAAINARTPPLTTFSYTP